MMPTRLAALVIVMAGVLALGHAPRAQGTSRPSLLVVLVVDQMRHDYIDRLGPRWTRGLHRMITEGAVFQRNAYPYLQTVTCAGHATIGTGSFPQAHGLILNAWWDRAARKQVACTSDPDQPLVAGTLSGLPGGGHSPSPVLRSYDARVSTSIPGGPPI